MTQHWLDNDLVPNRRQAIIWTDADPIHWRIYAALGEDELIDKMGLWYDFSGRILSGIFILMRLTGETL